MILVVVMGAVFLAGCTDSSQETLVVDVGYDPVAEVAKYELQELSDYEKNYTIQMGYRNCDHMVSAILGEKAGIYEALGLDVVVTKTGQIMEAMSSGEMDVGYQGLTGAIRSVNEGAPLFMAAANHLGGSEYLVVSNDIQKPEDLIGKTISVSPTSEVNPYWHDYCEQAGIPVELDNYETVSMDDADQVFALRTGDLDGFTTCDPYASQAEFEGIGHIIATGWGAYNPEKDTGSFDDWGMCCIYCMSTEFYEDCPELARRLVLAHGLSIQYLYEHPYNAAMMFAEGFDADSEVALTTVYMKTVAEGRTITWQFRDKNLENYIQNYYDYNIPEEEIPNINDVERFVTSDLLDKSGLGSFETFIEEEVDGVFPLGDSYEDWLEKAKAVDGIV